MKIIFYIITFFSYILSFVIGCPRGHKQFRSKIKSIKHKTQTYKNKRRIYCITKRIFTLFFFSFFVGLILNFRCVSHHSLAILFLFHVLLNPQCIYIRPEWIYAAAVLNFHFQFIYVVALEFRCVFVSRCVCIGVYILVPGYHPLFLCIYYTNSAQFTHNNQLLQKKCDDEQYSKWNEDITTKFGSVWKGWNRRE